MSIVTIGLTTVLLCVILLANKISSENPDGNEKIRNETLAAEWLRKYDQLASSAINENSLVKWNYETNITAHNQELQAQSNLRLSSFNKQAYVNASCFDWENFTNPYLKRQFEFVTNIGYSVLPVEDISQVSSLHSHMLQLYSTAEVCHPPGETLNSSACYPLEPALTGTMAKSRDWDELLWAWRGWRNATGRKMKNSYTQYSNLMNKAANLSGYADQGEAWRSKYQMPYFMEECERLWKQIRPLYQNVHAYVRRKLMARYSLYRKQFPKSGHIPAHIIGDMWGQIWGGIFELVIPFKNVVDYDVTKALIQQNYNASSMFRLADDFFTSLGLDKMPEEFWKNSVIERPSDGRKVVCHASAWDFRNGNDFRIKQCTEVTDKYLRTTHHEMGHVQYYLMYKHQPLEFRRGANPGFHEAVGDVMALSVGTPDHLQKIGLINITSKTTRESDINYLMKQALLKVVFLPFGYLIDKWRWGVFQGTTSPEKYNADWWKLRCHLQGLSPPVKRTEEDFDPGAKFHIPHNTPYIRYFVSYIIQFQFHKSLCEAAGHKGPLHRCDIYQSKAAGDKLRAMLGMGASRPWTDAMKNLTGQEKMDAGPLLEYFEPLHAWLRKQNEGYKITWDDNCPDFTSSVSTINELFSLYKLIFLIFFFYSILG